MNMQYKNSSTGCSKVIRKLKYLKNKGKLQGQVYDKILVTRNTHVMYQTVTFTVQKLFAKFKFHTE